MASGRASVTDMASHVAATPLPEAALRVYLLGGFRLVGGGATVPDSAWRLRKARSLVKLLALAPAQRLPREAVTEALWPELDPSAADNNLRGALHAARRALGSHGAITSRDGTLALRAHPDANPWIDAAAFEAAAEAARRAGDVAAYSIALDLYGGELLPEDRYEDWAAGRRDFLRGIQLTLLRELAALHERAGAWAAAIAALQRLLVAEPAHEEAHVALMRAFALAGQRAQALAQWEQLVAALRRELDAVPDAAARALYEEIAAGRFPPEGAARADERHGRYRHNLPIPPTALIGREADLVTVKGLLAGGRLVTLGGAGGVGKTRLALAVATDLLAAYPDGAWFADLAAIAAPERVPGAVVGALGMREVPGTPVQETLVARLAGDSALLILDNCEHLRDACATLAAQLLAACPGLRILATSRVPLGLPGEAVWRVPSLRLPDEDDAAYSPADLVAVPAVRLFVERVRWRSPAFEVTAVNARAVAAIARRLDGIPLALELAAARVAILTPEQLAPRLDDALRLLTGGAQAAPQRQQTLRATLEWSCQLLTPPQAALLARLGVFAGGCDLDAVEAVCADDGQGSGLLALPRAAILDALAALVDHSLVQVEPDGSATRYRLLETVRQFAAERLAEDVARAACLARHARHYLALAERETVRFSGAEQGEAFDRVERDHDNLRAALAWAVAHAEPETGLRTATALWMFWEARGHFDEGSRWFDALLALPAAGKVVPGVRAGAHYGAGALAHRLGDLDRAREHFAACLSLARGARDERRLTRALNANGLLAITRREYEEGLDYLHEAATLLRGKDDPSSLANVLNNAGLAYFNQGRHAEAVPYFEEALAVARGHRDLRTIARVVGNLSTSLHYTGDEAGSIAYAEEFLAIGRQLGDNFQVSTGLNNLAISYLEGDDLDRAETLLTEALAMRRELGDKGGIASSLASLGQVALERGDLARATDAGEEGLPLARAVNRPWVVAGHLVTLSYVALGHGRPLQAAYHSAEALETARSGGEVDYTFGALTLCARVALALGQRDEAARILAAVAAERARLGRPFAARDRRHAADAKAAVQAALTPADFAAAWSAGEALSLDEAVALAHAALKSA
jgi:predicted ATPase/DNA-binding SARP family transcriptional activator/Tfp pilus assembly protein PilF